MKIIPHLKSKAIENIDAHQGFYLEVRGNHVVGCNVHQGINNGMTFDYELDGHRVNRGLLEQMFD